LATIQLHAYTLIVPDEHWLMHIRRELPDYSENVGRLAAVVAAKYPDRGVIDIGANVGDTAAIVRAHCGLSILCIEGSAYYAGIIRQNLAQLGPDVEFEQAFVGAADAAENGVVKIERGTGFFRPDPGTAAVVRFEKLESILARHPRFLNSKLLKIDTDGMDGRIVVGSLDWLASAHPVVFWEHDLGLDQAAGGPGLSVFDRLHDVGYRKVAIFDNRGEYIQTLALDARQQLADLSDYLPGGDEFCGYCDMCAFAHDDLDLCDALRQVELESRQRRRKQGSR
jgi:FkbM family methyltransferase